MSHLRLCADIRYKELTQVGTWQGKEDGEMPTAQLEGFIRQVNLTGDRGDSPPRVWGASTVNRSSTSNPLAVCHHRHQCTVCHLEVPPGPLNKHLNTCLLIACHRLPEVCLSLDMAQGADLLFIPLNLPDYLAATADRTLGTLESIGCPEALLVATALARGCISSCLLWTPVQHSCCPATVFPLLPHRLMLSPDQTHNPSLMAINFLEVVLICTIAPCVPHCPELWVSLQIYHIK